MSPTILDNIYEPRATSYNLRYPVRFVMLKVHLVYNGTKTPSHLGPTIWSLI